MTETHPPTCFYPDLGSSRDLWFARVSGAGIGNGLYNYFHAMVLARQFGGTVISPPWFSLKLGPLLRGEMSTRLYWRMFRPYPGEISGVRKLITLLSTFSKRNRVHIDKSGHSAVAEGHLNVVACTKFTFAGLHEYREAIRERLLGIVRHPVPADHSWGKGGFIGVHVRLGDFTVVTDPTVISKGTFSSTRIPLSWYESVVRALRRKHPDMPVRIFSDGTDAELAPLLALGATTFRSGSDILDMLALSSCSLLVGSHSTYSRWAAFLGDMPSVWLDIEKKDEQPSGAATPCVYVPLDATEPAL